MGYSASEFNRMARDASSGQWYGWNTADAEEVIIYRALLVGGPPHGTKPVSHLSTLLPAMAEMPSVDCDEYVVKGVTLAEVPSGTTLRNQVGDEVTVGENTYIADVVVQAVSDNSFWFDEEDNEAKLRGLLANWGGGYSPVVTLLAIDMQDNASGPSLTAMEFWKQQPNLFYHKSGQELSKQAFYQENVQRGTLKSGFSEGLSDIPGGLAPFQWSAQQPGREDESLPMPVPQPPGPGQKPPATKASSQGMLVMAATAVLGYVLYRRWSK